ncbi:hypothetical protein A2U01_0067651, partial [Trifolium medium]|nr:hypothetical protein [Trifolium medium]
GALLSKSYNDGFALIESITVNIYQWPTTRATPAPAKKTAGIHEVTETNALAAQVAQIHNMIKTMMLPPALPEVAPEPVKVVVDSA